MRRRGALVRGQTRLIVKVGKEVRVRVRAEEEEEEEEEEHEESVLTCV